MRLRSSFLTPSRGYADAPVGDITGPDRGEAGAEADSWLNDLLGGGPDVNPELQGGLKFLQYDEMRKTDASVKSVLMFLKLPVRSAVWGLEPAADDPVDRLIADFVAQNLGLEANDGWMTQSWDKLLEQGLSMLDMGACIEEFVWDDVKPWYDADGDAHLKRRLLRLAPRPCSSIDKVIRYPDGSIKRVEQNIAEARPIIHTVERPKLSHMVFEEEAGRWEGVSVLRPAWGPWRLKRALMIAAGIGWDRFSMGLPVVHHPDTAEGEARAKSIGRSIRGHQRAYVRFPVPPGMTKEESEWALEIVNGAQTLADPTPLLKWFCDQIAEAGMQQFARQGMGETGARATAEVQVDPYFLAVQALANNIRRERSRQLIRTLVRVNFGEEAAERQVPNLTVSKIQARNVSVVASAIGILAGVGFTFTDREAQDDIREMLGLTALPDDLESMGIDRERLRQILAGAGLDETQLAEIVNSLPEEIGVARNRVAREGDGLGLTAARG